MFHLVSEVAKIIFRNSVQNQSSSNMLLQAWWENTNSHPSFSSSLVPWLHRTMLSFRHLTLQNLMLMHCWWSSHLTAFQNKLKTPCYGCHREQSRKKDFMRYFGSRLATKTAILVLLFSIERAMRGGSLGHICRCTWTKSYSTGRLRVQVRIDVRFL